MQRSIYLTTLVALIVLVAAGAYVVSQSKGSPAASSSVPEGSSVVDPLTEAEPQPASETASDTATEPEGSANAVSFNIVGTNMEYDLKQIKVKQGDVVTINFFNQEGFHDWVIDEFDARTPRIDEGKEATVTFIADKVGTFQYYCSVHGHRQKGMVGYLVVSE